MSNTLRFFSGLRLELTQIADSDEAARRALRLNHFRTKFYLGLAP
jgi:hypothetical protein